MQVNSVDTPVSQFASLSAERLDELARTRLLMLDSTRDGIYRIDRNGHCTFMNRAAGQMLGYEVGEAIGKNMHRLHHSQREGAPEVLPLACPIYGDYGSTLPWVSDSEVFRRVNGSLFPVECSSYPILEEGTYQGAVITFRDITERRRAEHFFKLKLSINRALDGAASIQDAFPTILECICRDLEFSWSAAWVGGPAQDPPEFVASWADIQGGSEKVSELNQQTSLIAGIAGLAWASGHVECMRDLAEDTTRGSRSSVAVAAGLRSGCAVPIQFGERVCGVLEFLRREAAPIDQDQLDVLAMVGNAIGRFIERIRAQSEKARLAGILDVATDFVGVVADDKGVVLTVNRGVEAMLGYAPAEVLGRPLSLLIPGYEKRLRASGWFDTRDVLHSSRFRMPGCHKLGSSISLEVSFGEYIENGSRLLTGIITDITDRQAAEEMLDRQAEELLRSEDALRAQTRVVQSIVASIGDGVIVADENSELLLVNPAAAMLVPVSVDQVLLEAPVDGDVGVFLPDGVTRCPADRLPLARAIHGESTDGVELFVRSQERPEGFWLSHTARPLKDEDGVLRGGVVILRDTTEQRLAREALHRAKEEAESANQAKSEFLSRMSHELRTPMNAILGFAQLLELDPLTPEQIDGTSRILKAGRHLLELINEILDISRIEAGRLNVEIEQVSALDPVQGAVELVRPLMAQRGIQLVWPEKVNRRWFFRADRQRLTQVFLNLLSNAVKYNREHGRVTIAFDDSDEGKLRIGIIDTGAGIAPENLQKLFVPFERLGADRTAIEGTGLGLALASRFMAAMGGSIGVESQVGVGTTFWVEMPLQRLGESKHEPLEERTVSTPLPADCPNIGKILYIEDNPSNLKLIESILARVPGFQLLSCATGGLGIELAKEHRPDLVLLDLQLPDMHGHEVLRRLRQQQETKGTPVVVVSADATARTRQDLLSTGANNYLNKPIDIREFLDVVTGFFNYTPK